MGHLRELFSRKNLPKMLLFFAIYILGRMEGEGRFRWGEVLGFTWDHIVTTSVAAAASARGIIAR